MRRRILFYVQHLLGIGHLVRAGRIAEALSQSFDVRLAVGGELPPGAVPEGLPLVRLPPVRAGAGGFGDLVHPDGSPFGDADRAARRERLLAAFDAFQPDVLLVEAFPFGRRQMRFELLPLLEHAASGPRPPLVACSVRDILQEVRPERAAETSALLRGFFGLVLVHGDPELAPLSMSFPGADAVADLVRHTGLVGPARPAAGAPGDAFDAVVSVGGGAVGARLLGAALAARPLTRLARGRWLLLTGPGRAPPDGVDPADAAVSVRGFVPDLAARLARARVSISQAGYNTAADLVAARCRAVLVPFAAGGETEQGRRAALFAARGLATVVEEAVLSPATLAAAVDAALDLPPAAVWPSLDGAETTRLILERRLDAAG